MNYQTRTGLLTLRADLGDLERQCAEAARECEDRSVAELVSMLQPVATSASARWYTQVNKRTGRQGRIAVEVRSLRRGFTIVGIGSTSQDVTETGAPVPRIVHRGGPGSKLRKVIPRGEPVPPGWTVARNWGPNLLITMPNPKASDGGNVLQDLVIQPADEAFARFTGMAPGIAVTALTRRGGAR